MQVDDRPAQLVDFDYCRSLYFSHLQEVTPEQEASFRERWFVSEVRIITGGGADIGWMQTRIDDGSLFLVQLFIEAASQGQGVGTKVLKRLMNDAAQVGIPMTLGVVKTNPARRLYERLGFKITHEDERKFFMRCEGLKGCSD